MIGQHLDETDKVKCPVSFHFGDQDPVVPMDEVEAIQKSYASHDNAAIVTYEGATHNGCEMNSLEHNLGHILD